MLAFFISVIFAIHFCYTFLLYIFAIHIETYNLYDTNIIWVSFFIGKQWDCIANNFRYFLPLKSLRHFSLTSLLDFLHFV